MHGDSEEERARRRAARANWEFRVFRADEREAMADDDALWWDRIPRDERPEFVWQHSVEMWRIAHPEDRRDLNEPGLSRSVARVLDR